MATQNFIVFIVLTEVYKCPYKTEILFPVPKLCDNAVKYTKLKTEN